MSSRLISLEQAIVNSIEQADQDLTVQELSSKLDVEEHLIQQVIDESERCWVFRMRRPVGMHSKHTDVIGYMTLNMYLRDRKRLLKLRYETKKRGTRNLLKKLWYKLEYYSGRFLT